MRTLGSFTLELVVDALLALVAVELAVATWRTARHTRRARGWPWRCWRRPAARLDWWTCGVFAGLAALTAHRLYVRVRSDLPESPLVLALSVLTGVSLLGMTLAWRAEERERRAATGGDRPAGDGNDGAATAPPDHGGDPMGKETTTRPLTVWFDANELLAFERAAARRAAETGRPTQAGDVVRLAALRHLGLAPDPTGAGRPADPDPTGPTEEERR